jgi:hypothetical protein
MKRRGRRICQSGLLKVSRVKGASGQKIFLRLAIPINSKRVCEVPEMKRLTRRFLPVVHCARIGQAGHAELQ